MFELTQLVRRVLIPYSLLILLLFPPQLDDEDSILPHKLQAALEHVLDKRRELACDKGDLPNGNSSCYFLFHLYIHNMLNTISIN